MVLDTGDVMNSDVETCFVIYWKEMRHGTKSFTNTAS